MKKIHNTMARMMVLCLSLVMALSLTTLGAFAAPITSATQTGTVTVTGSANDVGAQVNVYKVIDVNMDANAIQPKDPMYTWNTAVAQWVKENYPTYINEENQAVTGTFAEEDAKTLGDFYQALAASGVLGDAAHTATLETASATISQVAMGQYLVIATKAGNTYNPATATLYPEWSTDAWELNDVTVVLKGKGGIDKSVDGEGDQTHAVGDTVTYRVDVAIPAYPADAVAKQFVVGDTMGTGLTFDGITSVKVYTNTSANSYEEGDLLTPVDVLYTVVAKDNGFELTFDYDAVKAAVGGDTYVHVVYTATLNEDAFTSDGLGNTAFVGVNTNPYDDSSYETTTTTEDVYTYGITVTLKDAETSAPLANGRFQIKEGDTVLKFIDNGDGTYTLAEDQNDPTAVDAVVTDGNGQLVLQGVDTGTYTITQVAAPGGYQMPANPVVTVIMVDNPVEGKVDGELDGNTAEGAAGYLVSSSFAGNMFTVNLQNAKPGFELPTTGGMGTVLFTAGGLVIMACGAALVLVTLKKKKAED